LQILARVFVSLWPGVEGFIRITETSGQRGNTAGKLNTQEVEANLDYMVRPCLGKKKVLIAKESCKRRE
jgi:hypothetical protein